MPDRQGTEIDHCLQSRGVWLDGGELDRLVERDNRQASERLTATVRGVTTDAI